MGKKKISKKSGTEYSGSGPFPYMCLDKLGVSSKGVKEKLDSCLQRAD